MIIYKKYNLIFILICAVSTLTTAQIKNKKLAEEIGISDNGNGTFTNPILHSDYSDPDAIRVNDDYYMTASSFNAVPGLPILHSKDMVNWTLVNYALPKLEPAEVFAKAQHGGGVWAPCIRFHDNEYYIFYPDPDFGIFMVKTKDPLGTWSQPVAIKEGKGLIDPTPLWDEDGKVYLSYAFAGSRAGIKSLLVVCSLDPKTLKAQNDEVIIIDGHDDEATIEGPKLYKRNGFYYIFAPAGGVATGWQTVLRSKNIWGPYEKRKVLEQGKTDINGPHQGAWVQTQTGEDWFFHFQDKGTYGRIVHLQPMKWKNDWPIIGEDTGKGIGQPVLTTKKPYVGKGDFQITPLTVSDDFNTSKLGLQWQWHANPQVYWGFPSTLGHYTMYCQPIPEKATNLFDVPNLLLQKFPDEQFTATAKMTFNARSDGEQTGLLVMGLDYSYIKVTQNNGKMYISQVVCKNADKKGKEIESESTLLKSNNFYLCVKIAKGGIATFEYSENGKKFQQIGEPFTTKEGKWIGAKIGFLAVRNGITNDSGNVLIDWIKFTK